MVLASQSCSEALQELQQQCIIPQINPGNSQPDSSEMLGISRHCIQGICALFVCTISAPFEPKAVSKQ